MIHSGDTLQRFGNAFQTKVLACLLKDRLFLQQIGDILDPKYFSSDASQWLVRTVVQYFNEYKNTPTLDVLKVKIDELDEMVLPPCHYGFQVYTRELSLEERLDLASKTYDVFDPLDFSIPAKVDHDEIDKLYPVPKRAISLMWNQRSVDTFLGLPFNIASYGLLLMMLADEVNMVPDELILQIAEEFEKEKVYKLYLEVFGKNGITKLIMKTMMPLINQELQRLLQDSCYFNLEIRVNDKNEVEFIMIDNSTGIEKLMVSGSGYERTIAAMALSELRHQK